MIQKYPISIQDYKKLRLGNFLYVDKTEYVHQMADLGGYYFLSRPRRFGKSLLVSTLECVFTAQEELFEDTFIYDRWDWKQKYPVIRISFSNIGHKTLGLEEAISERLNEIYTQYEITISKTTIDKKFKELIQSLHSKFNQKVVVLIDEYDKPIIDYLGSDTKKAVENRELMKIFYSILKDADPYLKLVFITGVSKFSRVSIFSDLNNLKDLSQHPRFGGICGITQEELEQNFKKELQEFDLNQVKEWYNGYTWDLRTSIYNPFSLFNFFDSGKFQNFWFHTGTPTFLVEIAKNEQLYDVDNILSSANDLEAYNIENLEPLPLLFQTGYLTFKSYDAETQSYILKYPNKEVRQSYLEALANAYIQNKVEKSSVLAIKLRNSLIDLDFESLQNTINSLFKSIPYDLWQKENEHFYHAILHLVFNIMGIYTDSEIHSSRGRLDSLVRLKESIFCFEFKLDNTAVEALAQIKEKGYLEPYKNDGRRLFAIGVNFSKEKKEVDEILAEEL